jgi:hypothetical protein
MASKRMKNMNEIYRSIKERLLKRGLDLATTRDIVENLHLAAAEAEAVTYAEVDADGVPARWYIPQGSDPDRVLLHSHSGGSVVNFMHTDRKAIGHIGKAVVFLASDDSSYITGNGIVCGWRRRANLSLTEVRKRGRPQRTAKQMTTKEK